MSYFHVIGSADSLQRLAAKYYGKWTIWRLILDANPGITDWANLQPGIRIVIPEPFTDTIDHIIAAGDSYESLSMQYYGTEHFSGVIMYANNGVILDANIGQKIVIPPLVSKIEYMKAKRTYG